MTYAEELTKRRIAKEEAKRQKQEQKELAKKMAEEEKKRKAKQAEDEKIKGCAADMQHTLFGQNYRSVFMQSYRESVFRSEIL